MMSPLHEETAECWELVAVTEVLKLMLLLSMVHLAKGRVPCILSAFELPILRTV